MIHEMELPSPCFTNHGLSPRFTNHGLSPCFTNHGLTPCFTNHGLSESVFYKSWTQFAFSQSSPVRVLQHALILGSSYQMYLYYFVQNNTTFLLFI